MKNQLLWKGLRSSLNGKFHKKGKKRPKVQITMALWPPYVGGGVVYFDTLVKQLKDKVDFILLTQQYPGKKNIDLDKEGYDKLLGSGIASSNLKIKVNKASKKAIEKIKDKGGEVTLPK